eukprot:GHVQ01019388.1.p1 GENE.GHVQ01019388.1~~GHVQ01019388.1.p1  ORF type:complete len:296 (+),score=17.91 GHVQ01019388.1:2916-3803(+)
MSANQSLTFQCDSQAEAHVQAYLEYRNIVGETDGGALLSEAEYQALREKAQKAAENELYVFWVSAESQLECRAIGPSSMCFCGHRYRDHAWFDIQNKQVKCRMYKCKCRLFNFIPVHGSGDLKCRCKHSFREHDPTTKQCTMCSCSNYDSPQRCNCGQSSAGHTTTIETREERVSRGKIVTRLRSSTLQPMGGLTDMRSLLDGAEKSAISDPGVYAALENGNYDPTDANDGSINAKKNMHDIPSETRKSKLASAKTTTAEKASSSTTTPSTRATATHARQSAGLILKSHAPKKVN